MNVNNRDGHGLSLSMGWDELGWVAFPAHVMAWVGLNEKYYYFFTAFYVCCNIIVRKRDSTVLTVRVRYIIKAPLVLTGLSN